ncbi:uncharacterized protein L969DRAFT_92736 [Mixia osmundae IAM 14324]|uniref:ACB domain-containing protein n=1 Tax=Mixia osmundae (strain CBS 9802 / IAM 14324 / JCM 22182 / KY 12970) TaxID=764103 RepID=G7DYE6_MIXOS|nr:uncharacterized protein L969DRAFT_92736 [Mixia osmundae IAM 14324]KEI41508.1 hypothetical protein L969DRAFT_92736 [Mixia osmundae IAM 14324]GAA95606.1 hypothetical protein E5Q_02262 [Mixia osmundae IAM 14324]
MEICSQRRAQPTDEMPPKASHTHLTPATMSAQFKKAVDIIQELPKDGNIKPSQNDQLKFYGLYKQAKIGDVNTSRPGTFDFAGKAKWDAWSANKGMSQEDAQTKYVETFKEVFGRYEDDEEAKKALASVREVRSKGMLFLTCSAQLDSSRHRQQYSEVVPERSM